MSGFETRVSFAEGFRPATPPPYSGEERRGDVRPKALKSAQIRFNGGYSAFDCLMRNRNQNGAMLEFGDQLGMPAQFEIRCSNDEAWRSARIAWRKGSKCGIFFS